MKAKIILIAVIMCFAQLGFSQKEKPTAPPPPLPPVPGLTDEQISQIKDLDLRHVKELTSLHNELNELNAGLRKITTADNIDYDAVNKRIEDIGAVQIKIMKSNELHRLAIREFLNTEQKIIFDTLPPPLPVPPPPPKM